MHIAEKQELGAFIYDIHREVGRNRAKICSKFVDKHNRIWGVRWERGNRTVMGTSYIENPLWIEAITRSSLVMTAINKVNKLQSIHQTEFRKNEKSAHVANDATSHSASAKMHARVRSLAKKRPEGRRRGGCVIRQ